MKRYDQCDDTCTADCGHCKGRIPPIGPPSEGTGELAGGDVQPLPRSHHPRARKETKHDQRTPLPGDPDWEEHRRGGTHG